ncbi:MAG: insulinase family protein [Chloroflexaceae bacterium]|nr:insulinase family protein [Chloroflexaceae bacterium]
MSAAPFLPEPVRGGIGQRIASTVRFTLPNGMVVLLLPTTATPTVTVSGEVRVGAIHEPAEQGGLAVFTGAALGRGTQRRTFQQIVEDTEARGCMVSTGSGGHTTAFGGKSLAEDLPLVLEILTDMLQTPTFPTEEIEKLRGQFLMSLREYEQSTRYRAALALQALLYPPEHPYSRPASGTRATVQQISRDDLEHFHTRYHPAATTLAIVGDFDTDQVLSLLETLFGGWEPAAAPPSQTLPPVAPLTEVRRTAVYLPGKIQSDILWGVHGLERTHPDYYAALMANLILGQLSMGNRLWENVRERQGLAYSVSSSLDAGLSAGPWTASAGVNPADVERATVALLHEIEHFVREGPIDEEIADVRDYLKGSLGLRLETNGGIASMLLAIERYGLGLEYVLRYPSFIDRVDHDAIAAVAQRYLHTTAYALAVAGPPLDRQE